MSNTQKSQVSIVRILVVLTIAIAAGLASYFLSDAFRLAEKPAEYIGVVFSILAASLFAVVSIIGDPGMIMPGSSRHAWVSAKEIQNELQKFNYLFIWYLLTLGLLVASELVEHAEMAGFYWVINVFVFFSVFGFLISLFVPSEFARIQRRRLQQEIDARSSLKK
jgi:predicted membrane channel-forming protein YqfA (hemolysin III family)